MEMRSLGLHWCRVKLPGGDRRRITLEGLNPSALKGVELVCSEFVGAPESAFEGVIGVKPLLLNGSLRHCFAPMRVRRF